MMEGLRTDEETVTRVVSTSRDRRLIDRLFQHVGACCQFVQALLVCTDGFAAYPNSILRALREKGEDDAVCKLGRICVLRQ
jgi:hypothetical protein